MIPWGPLQINYEILKKSPRIIPIYLSPSLGYGIIILWLGPTTKTQLEVALMDWNELMFEAHCFGYEYGTDWASDRYSENTTKFDREEGADKTLEELENPAIIKRVTDQALDEYTSYLATELSDELEDFGVSAKLSKLFNKMAHGVKVAIESYANHIACGEI